MAKAPISDSIMSTDKMKPLLALSKREPVQAAIGLSAEGDGIILLDKKAKPKKVFSMLKASAAKAKVNLNTASLRFGRAEVDTDYDSGCVRFFVNKDAPGNLRVKLIELVKRIPYQKVEINVDPSLEEEPEEDADGEEAGAVNAQSEAPASEASTPPPAPPAPPQQAPQQQAAPQQDAGALRQQLTALVQRIPGVLGTDPSRKDSLLTLAKQGQTTLGANDLAGTIDAIEKLRAALDAPAAQKATAGATGGPVQYAKARLAWLAVRKQMEADLEKLRQSMLEFYQDADIATDLNRSYNEKVEPVLSALDESLADVLDDATNATDPAKRAELVAQAKSTIGRYQAYLGSEPLLKEIDGNPFVPLSIVATITKTLSTLSTAV